MRMPGQYFDQETNGHYNYFRDFDPSLGRYRQSDPIGLRGGLNTYAYVLSAPLDAIDEYGLAATCKGKWGVVHFEQGSVPRMPGQGRTMSAISLINLLNPTCDCYWLCYDCDRPVAWSGDPYSLPSTKGVWYYDPSGGAQNTGPSGIRSPNRPGNSRPNTQQGIGGGNTCICGVKPGPEEGCNKCRP
jgi:RHS repeat-associated protein